jgi:hypothetical protein
MSIHPHWQVKHPKLHHPQWQKFPLWFRILNVLANNALADRIRLKQQVASLTERLEGALSQATEAGKLALPLYIENENLKLEMAELKAQLDNPIGYQNSNGYLQETNKNLTRENAELAWRLKSAIASRDLILADWENLLKNTQ